MKRLLPVILFLICTVNAAKGEGLRQITSREGLSNSSILSLAQDADGYLWVGTCDGLNRWDGVSMHSYKSSGNLVQEILPTDDGALWIRTNYGLDKLNARTKLIEMHTEFPRVYLFTARGSERAFMVYNDTLYYYDSHTHKFLPTDYKAVDMNSVSKIYYDRNERLWFISRSAIASAKCHYDTRPSFGDIEQTPHKSEIRFTTYDNDTIYFIDAESVLYALDINSGKKSYIYDLSQTIDSRGEVSAIARDGDDYIISFEMSGAVRLRAQTDSPARYEVSPINIGCGVFSLHKDRNQNILWIGTDGSGLYQQTNFTSAIRSVTFDMLPYKITKPVKALFVDGEQRLWIGTKNDGIIAIDDIYTTREFTTADTRSFTVANSPIGKNSIYAFTPSRRGLLWIGGDGNGVNYYSYRDRRIHTLRGSESLRNIHDMLETSDTTLYVATIGQGMFRLTLDRTTSIPVVKSCTPIYINDEVRAKNFFFSICRESDSVLWFGNHGVGAVRYNTLDGSSRIVRFDSERGLATNDVTAIVKDTSGVIRFGTGCGLESYPADSIDRCGMTNVIHSIECDGENNLWLGTNTGVVKYDPRSGSKVIYSHAYGLDIIEFSDEASFRDTQRGVMFFGGINGFVQINENLLRKAEPFMPPLLLTDVNVNGKVSSAESWMRHGVLTVKASHTLFTLSFAAIDYINGSNYSYFYKLGGEEWTDNGHIAQLTLANLHPGRYTLEVCYHNNITGYRSSTLNIPIRIPAPWYASTVAYLLYALTLIGVVVLFIRRYIRRNRARIERNRQEYEQRQREILYESRLASLTNITNDLSIPLTLINGPCQQILDSRSVDPYIRKQADTIQHNAMKLTDLIYMLNEFKESNSTKKSDKIELLNITLLMTGIAQTFESYTQSNEIDYTVAIDDNIAFPTGRDAVSMIVGILLNNAVKRTQSHGELNISVTKVDDTLRITIANRGEMIDKEQADILFDRYRMFDCVERQQSASVSFREELELAICGNMIDKLNGSLDIDNSTGSTLIRVTLPRLEITKVTDATPTQHPEAVRTRKPELPTIDNREYSHNDTSRPTMLIAHDDLEIMSFIAELFAPSYNIILLRKEESADTALAQNTPDIVVCGSMTLNSSIVNFIRKIKSDKHSAQIPVVFLSAAAKIEDDIDNLDLGIDICLTLPFNVRHLQAVAERLIKKYRSLKDYGQSILNSFDFTGGRMLHRDDKLFLDSVLDIINDNIHDARLSTQYIADKMGMSLCNIYRKLGGVSDDTPANIIKEYRLRVAAQLLMTTKLNIDEIIYKSGFLNRSTFFRCFTVKYGCTPKAYRKQKIEEAIGGTERA